jgi:hypothetical protein
MLHTLIALLTIGADLQAPHAPRRLMESAVSSMGPWVSREDLTSAPVLWLGDVTNAPAPNNFTIATEPGSLIFENAGTPLFTVALQDGRVRIDGEGWSVKLPIACDGQMHSHEPLSWLTGCTTDPALVKRWDRCVVDTCGARP